jgi:hypothetical protein
MLNPTLTRVPPPSRWETIVMVYFAVNAVKQTGSQDMNITSLVELCTILVGFIAEHGLAGCMILIVIVYFAVNAVKQTGSQDMNITSLVELCTILVGFIAEHGLAGCMILINDPYHLIVIGK